MELKIDGVAVSILYENGVLRGATRGDGHVGDDITHNIRGRGEECRCGCRGKDVPPGLEVRGEIYMTNSDLVEINEERQEEGLKRCMPIRGTWRRRDQAARSARVVRKRRLRFFCHGVGYAEGLPAKTHMEFLEQMLAAGACRRRRSCSASRRSTRRSNIARR